MPRKKYSRKDIRAVVYIACSSERPRYGVCKADNKEKINEIRFDKLNPKKDPRLYLSKRIIADSREHIIDPNIFRTHCEFGCL